MACQFGNNEAKMAVDGRLTRGGHFLLKAARDHLFGCAHSNAPMPQEVAQARQEQQQQAGCYLEALAKRNSQVRSVLLDK